MVNFKIINVAEGLSSLLLQQTLYPDNTRAAHVSPPRGTRASTLYYVLFIERTLCFIQKKQTLTLTCFIQIYNSVSLFLFHPFYIELVHSHFFNLHFKFSLYSSYFVCVFAAQPSIRSKEVH